MKYLSVFSGIEAATVAWRPLGWEAVAFAEIEKFPEAVLAHHYPDVPNLGDVTKYKEWPIERGSIDILVGGSPCQAFSIAGLRKGLDDPRGNLMLVYGAIAAHLRPQWFVWENVPGVLSSGNGQDFASFLGLLTGQRVSVPSGGWQNSGILSGYRRAYGVAWRILDAQYVRVESHPRAVPQRRRRVFVVGYLGDWRRAAAVLFESESLSRYTPPRREAGERVAHTVSQGPPFSRTGNERVEAEALIAFAQNSRDEVRIQGDGKIAGALAAESGAKQQTYIAETAHSLRGEGFDASEDGTGRGTPITVDVAPALTSSGRGVERTGESRSQDPIVADSLTSSWHKSNGATAGNNQGMVNPVINRAGVRRLTPVECERLQGFPDNYTRIPWRGKPAEQCPDGPRYKAIGNSMATNIMEWIGKQMEKSFRDQPNHGKMR